MIALRTDIFKTSSIILYYDFDVINLLLHNSAEINKKYTENYLEGVEKNTQRTIQIIFEIYFGIIFRGS